MESLLNIIICFFYQMSSLLSVLIRIIFLVFTFTYKHIKSDIFFNYVGIKIKVIGLDIEIKSKEKSAPSDQDKR